MGKVRREGGREKRGGTDGETDRWKKRRRESFYVMKQETGRGKQRKRSIWGREGKKYTP